MSKIAVVLREEIIRLARKEAKALTKRSQSAVAKLRKDIAELKRRVGKAQVEIARLKRSAGESASPPAAEVNIEKVRYSAASVKAQRRRLGLSAADFGTLIGVTGHTVYKWEHGASRPRSSQLAAFAAVRGIGKREANARLEQLRVKVPKGRKKTGQR